MKILNILIISNNTQRREHLARLLSALVPASRCVATTGEQALAAVHEQRWDTLISDLEMPEVTGLQRLSADTQLLLSGKQSPAIVDTTAPRRRDRQVVGRRRRSRLQR